MMYQVQATVSRIDEHGWSLAKQVPTFFLSSDIQGITSVEHAERIAREMLREIGGRWVSVSVDVVPVQ
jgi:uncharacterized protein (UPF0212 family)